MQSSTIRNTQPLVFKGNAYTLTTLQLLSLDIAHIQAALADKIAQAPKFFEHIPLVLDLQKLSAELDDIDLLGLLECLRQHKLIPIGIRGANLPLQEKALEQGLACLSDTKVTETPQPKESKTQVKSQPSASTPTRIITQPVRSGQQIYVPGGDLIVLATVSHGAEILADGNIHVYAPLRGRALAGVMGDTNTYIFCQSLEAELISVAGQYRISEQLKETTWQQAAQISLCDGHLRIAPL
jgi:septum site-determining protein MinC